MSTKTKGDILAERIESEIKSYHQSTVTMRERLRVMLEEYRKPWTLGRSVNGFTLGEGQEWHRNDWTEDMLPDGWRPVMCGEREAEGDEELRRGTWEKVSEPFVVLISEVDWHTRTRRPLPKLKPSPKLVPLWPEDVPPGSAIRSTKSVSPKSWISVLNVISIGVEIAGNDGITTLNFSRLKEECWQISRDNGKTWEPCHKEAK